MGKEENRYAVDEGGVLVRGPLAVGRLTVHDDGTGIVGLDTYFWSNDVKQPKDMDEADEDMDNADIEGGFFWDLSEKGWRNHSKFVSNQIGRKVILTEGGEKTDARENSRYARQQEEGA